MLLEKKRSATLGKQKEPDSSSDSSSSSDSDAEDGQAVLESPRKVARRAKEALHKSLFAEVDKELETNSQSINQE